MPKRGTQPTKAKQSKASISKKSTPKKDIIVEEGKASVTYTVSITKSLAPYESMKVQAGITIPYGASDELMSNLDDLLVVAREKVVARLSSDIDNVTDSLT